LLTKGPEQNNSKGSKHLGENVRLLGLRKGGELIPNVKGDEMEKEKENKKNTPEKD